MTDNTTYVSRRDRRRAARKSLAGAHAASAGRATAAVLAASGLVISSGVAANASEDSDESRDSSTVQLNASELTVERASQTGDEAATVSHEAEAELSFDRPAITSEASPERVAAEEAAAEQAERDAAAAEQAAEAQQAAEAEAEQAAEAQAQQEAEAQQAAEAQAQQEAEAQQAAEAETQQAESQQEAQPAQQSQEAQPAQQQTEQQSNSNSGASTAGETEEQPASSSGGGHSGVVGAAYSMVGTPYSYGGTSPGSGLDCSGMIQVAYSQAGISVPRTTHGMAGLPQVSSPAPGDIVLANGNSHGAIYIGNGQVISATSTGGVRVHGLHEGWHNVNSYHRPG